MDSKHEEPSFKLAKPFFVHYCNKRSRNDWALEYHHSIEIFFLVEGKFNFFIDNKIYELRPGDMVLIPPDVLHKAFYLPDVPITRYMLHCDTKLLPKVTRDVLLSSDYYVGHIPKALGSVEDIFFKLNKEYLHPDILSDELILGYMTDLATLIFRSTEVRRSTDVKSSNSVVEQAIAYLKNNYSSDVNINELAQSLSLSAAHLSRTFKSETGLGIKEYLIMYRLKQAELMLIEYPSKPISEIAYDCGFNDSNYFASCFRKAVGVTPTEFRKTVITRPTSKSKSNK